MKINLLSQTWLATAVTLLFACQQTPRGDNAQVTEEKTPARGEGVTYRVDNQATSIQFTGNGVGKNHPGVFRLSEGKVMVAGGQVTGGQFGIDIRSMKLSETGDAIQNKLHPHLLSADFFDAENYPSASFEITQARPLTAEANSGTPESAGIADANYEIAGNLTLKGTTKNVRFPARIDVSDKQLTARASFNIDRSQWGMSYRNDQSLGDKFISPTVNIQLDLRAAR